MWQGYTEWLSATMVANELEMDVKRVLELAKRMYDQLPVVFIDGNRRQWMVRRKDLNEWIARNSEEAILVYANPLACLAE